MGKAKRKRREATVEDLMAAQANGVAISQSDIPPSLNVFATMDAAWEDFVSRWLHVGLPDRFLPDVKFTFFSGVQAAANLLIYCEGQGMFGKAADQLQADCIAYEKEAEAVAATHKAEEWRTADI
jgi:hypothetical protein